MFKIVSSGALAAAILFAGPATAQQHSGTHKHKTKIEAPQPPVTDQAQPPMTDDAQSPTNDQTDPATNSALPGTDQADPATMSPKTTAPGDDGMTTPPDATMQPQAKPASEPTTTPR